MGDFLLNQEYSTFKLQCNWILRMNVIQKIKTMRQCPFVHFCERKANQWQQQHLNEMLNVSVLLKIIPAWKFLTAVSIFHLFCIFSYSLQLLLTSLFVTLSLGYSTTRRANFNKLPTDNVNVSESSQWFDSLSLSLAPNPRSEDRRPLAERINANGYISVANKNQIKHQSEITARILMKKFWSLTLF